MALLILAHEGHGKPEGILEWIGIMHPLFLHFPIVLIYMTFITEILFRWRDNPFYDRLSRFLIISAALFAIPTALTGLAFSLDADYKGLANTIFWWHRFFGISTAVFAILAAALREVKALKTYYFCLGLLIILVSITGFLGGELTFSFFLKAT